MAGLAPALNGKQSARASDVAYARLRERIVGLQLPPGMLVDEQSLAADIGLGRMPVHEALARLAGDQLVIVMPRRGLLIAPISLETVREIFEAREAIECGNAYFAARHASDAELVQLRRLIEAAEAAREVSDRYQFLEDDQQIHRYLAGMVRNVFLRDAADKILTHSLRFWRYYFLSQPLRPNTLISHRPLLAELEARNPEGALSAMREHIVASRQLLNDLF
jgi:DNA-binding GntR family transcriptional regulator